jgi:hypothetical protein
MYFVQGTPETNGTGSGSSFIRWKLCWHIHDDVDGYAALMVDRQTVTFSPV